MGMLSYLLMKDLGNVSRIAHSLLLEPWERWERVNLCTCVLVLHFVFAWPKFLVFNHTLKMELLYILTLHF